MVICHAQYWKTHFTAIDSDFFSTWIAHVNLLLMAGDGEGHKTKSNLRHPVEGEHNNEPRDKDQKQW